MIPIELAPEKDRRLSESSALLDAIRHPSFIKKAGGPKGHILMGSACFFLGMPSADFKFISFRYTGPKNSERPAIILETGSKPEWA
jgi:hypothetical protein